MKIRKFFSVFWIIAVVFVSCFGTKATVFAQENEFPTNLYVSVNGAEPVIVKAVSAYYEYNYYVSARDIAAALVGTEKQFNVTIAGGAVSIERGAEYAIRGDENTAFSQDSLKNIYTAKAKLNQITVDEKEVRYYNFLIEIGGVSECFLRLSDVALIFDVSITEEGDVWYVNTEVPYEPDLNEMEAYGYFSGMNSALVADATTGEIFYAYRMDEPFAIASITKLMNYIVIMDAVSAGEISEDDMVTISENAARMSRADDGMILMTAGKKVPIQELIKAMLVPSCNEASLALAEHLCGSEEAFVERMNEKAAELGLSSAVFYSSNGLPVYSKTLFAAKLSNQMSTRDLFEMINYILETYPQIMNITTIDEEYLPTLNAKIQNNNPLFYNMTDIKGMKSGTTTRAGTCLSTMREVTDPNGMIHQVVAIELGTETSVDRGSYSEVLMRYGSLKVQRGEHGVVSKKGITPYPAPQLSESSAPLTVFVMDTAKYYGLLTE